MGIGLVQPTISYSDMISHEHKCIFIHISKCAGSSIEKSFGIDNHDNSAANNSNLFGWSDEHKIYLQHATPQELIDLNILSKEVWDSYYKFIVIRNPWDRALSDYKWLSEDSNLRGSFTDFVHQMGCYEKIMKERNMDYRGDHMTKQSDYFILDNRPISYDTVVRFEEIDKGLAKVVQDLSLDGQFFNHKINVSKKRQFHYSLFYNLRRRNLVKNAYSSDISLFGYSFENRKSLLQSVSVAFSKSINFLK